MPVTAMARALKAMGFDGVDLTVRSGGRIDPAQVERALPAEVEAIRAEGLLVPMLTTELLRADEPPARPVFAAAGKLGVPFLKPGYYKYAHRDVRRELREAGEALGGLASLARRARVQLTYHNHADTVGASVWDIAGVIDRLDPRWVGYCFDTRHAFSEGGVSGWKTAAHLVGPRTKTVAVKDFHWEKAEKGWAVKRCPVGQGMVDVRAIFQILAAHGFAGPISLHLEYPIEGGEDAVLKAADRDLRWLKARLAEAYGNA
jgi:sugar phosphate isomerase/epimerase